MKINKEYRRGGLFGNSQNKFEDKSGAGGGINMAFGRPGVFGKGKGRALRSEKRYLKRLARQGKLNEAGPQSQERLDYLRNVQKDRAKKIGIGAGLAAGAAFGAPALAGAIKAKGGLGAALQGLKGKGILQKASRLGNLFGGRRRAQQEQQLGDQMDTLTTARDGMRIYPGGGRLVGNQKRLDADGDGSISGNDFTLLREGRKGDEGLKVPEGANTRSLLLSLSNFLKEREKESKSIDIPKSDKELLEMLLKRNHPREFQIAPPPRDQRFR